MPRVRVMRDNPIVRVQDSTWGKGKPYSRFKFFQHKKTGRRVSKSWAKSHPRSVKGRYGYVSKVTGKVAKSGVIIDQAGLDAWRKQGFLESTADKKFRSPKTQAKWTKHLLKTLKEYRATHIPPKTSKDLYRYLDYLSKKRPDFYETLVDADLAPKDPNFFAPKDSFDEALER